MSIHNKAIRVETAHDTEKLVLPASHGFNVLVIDDIIRLEAEGSYTKVVVKDGKKTIVSRTLKDFESTMPKEKFYRIHKSHLINLKYVKEYSNTDGNFVIMTDGSRIEISRRKSAGFHS